MMGRREADADGIKYYYDASRGYRGFRGTYVFLVPCSRCGETMEVLVYGRQKKYVCDRCKANEAHRKREVESAWFDVIEEKGEHRFNRALDEIQRQVDSFAPYERAARLARKAQGKYGSVPEAMVAVELARIGLSFIPQQKILRYRVDFYIPKIKLIIEVDGEVFHANDKKSSREAEIQIAMGFDTRILHIPAGMIRKDIRKLKPLIEKRMKMP